MTSLRCPNLALALLLLFGSLTVADKTASAV
jgi:hypothetical protein